MQSKPSVIQFAMIIIIGLVFAAGVVSFYLKHNTLPAPVVIDTKNQPTLGNANAKIHIVVFEDLKCVNCARYNNDLFPIIKKQYIDIGIANYTVINLAFMNGSLPAANAARCVYAQNPVLFFSFIDKIYENQPPENEDWANIPKLLDFASQVLGINTEQLAQCLVASPYNAAINDNFNQASKLMNGAVKTPSVYINGILVDPLTHSQIEKIINTVK